MGGRRGREEREEREAGDTEKKEGGEGGRTRKRGREEREGGDGWLQQGCLPAATHIIPDTLAATGVQEGAQNGKALLPGVQV